MIKIVEMKKTYLFSFHLQHTRALRHAVICGEFCGYRKCGAFAVWCSAPQEDELRCGAVAVAVVICINSCSAVAVLFCCSAVQLQFSILQCGSSFHFNGLHDKSLYVVILTSSSLI